MVLPSDIPDCLDAVICLPWWKQNTSYMSRRTIAIATALSVLVLGSPMITARANPLFVQYFDQGLERYEAGDYQGAIADYTKAIKIDPMSSRAYHNRGAAKQELNLHKSAINDFNKAIELEKNNEILYHYYNNRAWSKYNVGDLKMGLIDADKSIELNQDYMHSFDTRGRIRQDLGDVKGACSDFKKSVSLGNQITVQYLNTEKGLWCR